MADLTATVIGASGRMGQEHVAAYVSCGVNTSRTVCIGADIVSIASPDWFHSLQGAAALRGGSNIFCEKPIATQEAGLSEIKHAAKNLYIGQNFPLRHQSIFKELKEYDFGKIYRIDAAYNWGRTHKLNEGWRADDPNYSLVMGGLIHMVDLVLWLTGLDMKVVSAIGCNKSAPGFKNHDTVSALCKLSNGGVCNLTVDGGSGVDTHNHFIRIHGTKGGLMRINTEKTDKQACIKEFVKNIRAGMPPERDFRATEICLQIDKLASISDAH